MFFIAAPPDQTPGMCVLNYPCLIVSLFPPLLIPERGREEETIQQLVV